MKKQNSILQTLKNKRGEAYIDTAFKILIAIVVGALIFSTIYTLFDETILSNLTSQVSSIFSTGTSLNSLDNSATFASLADNTVNPVLMM